MQTAVGTQQAELTPPFVDIRRCGALETTDIMTPETKSAQRQGKSPAKRLCHGDIACGTIAAPVCRELLSADGRRTREQYGFSGSSLTLQQFKNCLIVQIGIIVMHFNRIGMVKIRDIFHRDSLTKVGFEAVYTHIQQRL